MANKRLAVLIAYTGDGGVERMMNHLLRGFVDAGVSVDLLLLKARGGHLQDIPSEVNTIRLDVRTSILALPSLCRYLREHRPDALLAAKDRAGRVALMARRLTGARTRVVLRMGMHLSGSLQGKTRIQKLARHLPVRWLYPWADAIVAVAPAVAEDLARIGQLPHSLFHVVPNPTIGPDLRERSQQGVQHRWLQGEQGDCPTIVAAGRLRPQKDFATLLKAFRLLQERRSARLIILGEGPERPALQAQAQDLGMENDVDLPGFYENPYPIMRAASLFVLSSRFEGSPNVLVEAMALGTPVVATDCPSGPRTILAAGRHGPLVPVGNAEALATAMEQTLDQPPTPNQLRDAVRAYTIENSTQQYLRVLGLNEPKIDTNQK